VPESRRSLVALALLAPLVGAIAGGICALFRLALERLDILRGALIGDAHGHGLAGFFCVVAAVCGGVTALSAWLVRRFAPDAGGVAYPMWKQLSAARYPQRPFA
jgi:CIC family chloride channel protein